MIKLENSSAELKNKTLMCFSAGRSPRRHAVVETQLLEWIPLLQYLIPQANSDVVIGANPLKHGFHNWSRIRAFLGFDAKMWLCNIEIKNVVILLYMKSIR